MPPARITVLAVLAALGVSCGSGPPPAIDPALAASVPPAATILAGVNLERVRASPLYRKFPPAALAFIESLGTSSRSVLFASDGGNSLVLRPGLAAMGSPDWVRAAGSSRGAANGLIPRAEPLAATSDIWVVAAGNANLPFTGNGENLNRMLNATEYATLSVKLTDQIAIEAVGMCPGAETGRHLEETLRAFLMLGGAGAARQPALADLLRRIRVTREDRAVYVNLMAAPGELEVLFESASH